MRNYRAIFNPNYSYIGLIIIIILLLTLILLEKKKSLRVIGYSFLASGLFLLAVYLLSNLIITNMQYKFFIEIITNNFFSYIVIISVLTIAIGTISIYMYRYIE